MLSWATSTIPPLDSRFTLPDLSLYDSASQNLNSLVYKDIYRMYVCGITPYDATHLGHANTYLAFDLINRFLRGRQAEIKYVQNITDIDDPLLERANRDGQDWQELARTQIDLFRSDMVALRVLPPDHYIGAVEAIPQVISAISMLEKSGNVYKVESDLYFKVRSDIDFGKRSHLSQLEMLELSSQRGGDPDRIGKQDPLDALLWLAKRPNEPGWESEFGVGRPGWHIECCTIALSFLDLDTDLQTSIDIQGGGSDLIFPHHEISAAQAKAMTGKDFAANYVHAGMVGLDGEKMSKSKGNLVFVSQLLRDGRDPMVIRIALISSHYRSDQMWNQARLDRAEIFLQDLRTALSMMEVASTDGVISEIIAALADDLESGY
jgi:L-cysteine:1D-myo-inositol 2-amino-2-deoxy-alpha-D-glucopyranoside ligase